jgi:membrane fusion protein (multidrug efflux system)
MTARARLLVLALLAPLAGCPGQGAATPPPVTGAAAGSAAPPAAPAPVASDAWVEVAPRTLREEVPAMGSFRARRTTRVGPEVGGEVVEVLVDVGDVVTPGQPLARLDPTFFEIEAAQRRGDGDAARARLASAEQAVETALAEVDHARAALAEAELGLERMRNLWEKPEGQAPSIPKSRFDAAVFGQREAAARVRSADSRVAEARARHVEATVAVAQAGEALRYAEERLGRAVVTAPFAGVVTRRFVDPGEPVTATPVTHLLEVQEVSTLYLEFSLPQELLSTARKGTAVRLEVEGLDDGAFEEEVSVVFPTVDEATRSFRCRVEVDNAARRLSPGLLARVWVTTREVPDALVVPRAALEADDRGWSVQVLDRDGRPTSRAVTLGLVTEREAQVVAGLSAGERVLVGGAP